MTIREEPGNLDVDLDSPEFAEKYEETLTELVTKCPVARSSAAGGYWLVSRYEDVRACAQDWETFSNEGGFEPGRAPQEGQARLYPVELDPPYQTRWRNALGPYFNPRAIEKYDKNIRVQVDALIDEFIEKGSCDWVEEFAAQLPGRVFFASFLGVPLSELPAIQKATDDAMRGPVEQRLDAWGYIGGFLDGYLRMREKEPPRDDFVDAILRGVEDNTRQPCPWEHKLYIIIDLLAGGIGTTTFLLSGMAYHLATYPEDKERLAADPSLHMQAIEELIRYYAAIVALGRLAKKDADVAGQKIAKGDFLMLSYAAAARDPQIFEHPNEVDIDRKITVNPAFSFGPHRCIGSHIARQEARITLEEVLKRMPDLAIPPGKGPKFSNSTITRNMDSLPLTFTPGARLNPEAQ
jgi:cytochrome P450